MLADRIRRASSRSLVGRLRDRMTAPDDMRDDVWPQLWREAMREPLTAPKAVKLADGTYDPFALEDERRAAEDQARVLSARNELAARLCAMPAGRRDPWAGRLAEYLAADAADHAAAAVRGAAAQLKLNVRQISTRVVRHTATGTLHLLPSIVPAGADLPGLWNTKLACGAKARKHDLQCTEVGDWAAADAVTCAGCQPAAEPVTECRLTRADVDLDLACEHAVTLLAGWMACRLQRIGQLADTSWQARMRSEPEWFTPGLGGGGRVRARRTYAQAAGVIALLEQVAVVGDDAVAVLLGEDLPALRSRLRPGQHRIVDLLDAADHRQLASCYCRVHDTLDTGKLLHGLLRHKTGLHPGLSLSDKALTDQITGRELFDGDPVGRWDALAELDEDWR